MKLIEDRLRQATQLSTNYVLFRATPRAQLKGAHELIRYCVSVPVQELNIVLGENYCDRGAALLTVVLMIIHQDFDPYTLRNDVAMLRTYETVTYK